MIENEDKVIFSWLHLSDIHSLHGNIHHQVDQEMTLKALALEIQKNSSAFVSSIPKPDALFVTGDIAFSGGERSTDEYRVAERWLVEVSGILNLDPESVFIVPGNHDIQRSVAIDDDDISMLVESLREKKRDLEWALSKEKQRVRLMSRLKNYLNFASKFVPIYTSMSAKSKELYWQRTLPISTGFNIQLLGLNTALLSQGDDDEGRLSLSLSQIKDFPDLNDDPRHLAIVLSHHPLSWLRDGAAVEGWLRKKAHIYLCGHIHDPESISYRSGGGTELIRIQAGALHAEQCELVSSCFNYGAIVLKSAGQFVVRIWNKSWSARHKDFRDDPDCHPSDQMYAEHPLSMQYVPVRSFDPKKVNVSETDSVMPPKVFIRRKDFISDSPPVVDVWVGRELELSVLNHFQSGVMAITGIGGQGKSAFASKYLEIWSQTNPGYFWDWRDCREQREQFHTKLVSIIENVSGGRILGNQLDGAQSKELVRFFFELVADLSGLIVLDNVDHYVDVSTGKFTLGVADFIEMALKCKHNLIILVTCRPRINYASPRFHEAHLKGISPINAVELFRLRGVKMDVGDQAVSVHTIHALTEGHPLWLNLIATQIANKLTTFEDIVDDLERGAVDDRAKTMMRTIWKGLNYRQIVILRYMSELLRPEDIDWIHECVKNEIKSWNQFRRTFQSLQTLNLIIETHGVRGTKEFDLHPIVRSFIRTEFYSRTEREPFLDRVIWVVDSFISKFAKTISIGTHVSLLENWIFRAELALRKDDLKTAITTLVTVGEKIVLRGMPGDLFRVGEMILEKCQGVADDLIDFRDFHNLNDLMSHTYAEYGREENARKHIERYSAIVPKDTAQFIAVCDSCCYVEWILGNYEEAILWGKEGMRIKNDSNIDTRFDTSNNLALALRDSGNIEAALSLFLDGVTIEDVISNVSSFIEKGAAFFGNIGRCLQFQGLTNQALECYVRSASILEKEEDESTTFLNKGYAGLWIGEILEGTGDYCNAYLFYRRAEMIWVQRAPLKAEEPRKHMAQILAKVQGLPVLSMTETGVERAVKQWINQYMNEKAVLI